MNKHPSQQTVDSMLRRGIVFSIVWLEGVGSFIAVVQAIRARKMILESAGQITGMEKVWWCLIVGGLGLVFWAFVLIMAIVNGMRE